MIKKVLLVDDELVILQDRSQIIKGLGYECMVARDGQEAIDLMKEDHPDVIMTDIKMPNKDGIDVLNAAREFDPHMPVILFTGYGTIASAVGAMKIGAFDYIQKPFTPENLEQVLDRAMKFRNEHYYNGNGSDKKDKKIYHLPNVIGRSDTINDLAAKIHKVSQSDANVLVYGESGTGKELIAKSIHQTSNRANEPFIPLDCISLPETLLESEIFGFEQGSFTGAIKSKPGVMELANNGTLFLDEITELDMNLQAKLLRVLQERQFRRIGGKNLITVNVRIISATNLVPEEAVRNGKLRQDLYYRLNVVPIFIPPLRDRREDIPQLVQSFIKKFNPSCPNRIEGIDKEALIYLSKYNWPGNVRELQNAIEQAMSMTENRILQIEDLPQNILEEQLEYGGDFESESSFKEAKRNYVRTFSKKYLKDLLDKSDGNISKMARAAGMSRRTIYRMLDELKIDY